VTALDLNHSRAEAGGGQGRCGYAAKGKQLLQKVQQAVGGAEKLAGVKDLRQVAEVQIDPSVGGPQTEADQPVARAGTVRQEVEAPFGKLLSFTNGTTGLGEEPSGDGALAGPMLKQAQGEIFRSYFGLMNERSRSEPDVNYAGPGALDISDKSGNSVRLMVDESTGLPVKTSYAGPQETIEENWSELRDVDGMKVPFKITVIQAGKKFAEVTVQEFKVNTGATAEQLSKRQ